MRCLHSRLPLIFVITILLLAGSLAFSGCQQNITLPYAPISLSPPPVELSLEKLYNDYMVDAEEAEARYSGERFLFKGLVVDDVESYFLNSRAFDVSIMVDNVKFKPRYEHDLDNIFPGFVVDVTGVPQSLLLDRILIVTDYLVFVVEGNGYQPPMAY